MVRISTIILLALAICEVIGCGRSQTQTPIWKNVKITDITPTNPGGGGDFSTNTTDFTAHIFEMPTGNIQTLDGIWKMLYLQPIKFNNESAFRANSFAVGFGQIQMWDKIAEILRTGGARRLKAVSLLLSDGEVEDLDATTLVSQQTIFYISETASMKGATLGPGKLCFRIKTKKIPTSRGTCHVELTPAFTVPAQSSIPQLALRQRDSEFLFNPMGFRLDMSPGEFVLLGPREYNSRQITLDSLIFSKTGQNPTIKVFLLVCARMGD